MSGWKLWGKEDKTNDKRSQTVKIYYKKEKFSFMWLIAQGRGGEPWEGLGALNVTFPPTLTNVCWLLWSLYPAAGIVSLHWLTWPHLIDTEAKSQNCCTLPQFSHFLKEAELMFSVIIMWLLENFTLINIQTTAAFSACIKKLDRIQ